MTERAQRLARHPLYGRVVGAVADEGQAGAPQAAHRFGTCLRGVGAQIDDDDIGAGAPQRHAGRTADITTAARHHGYAAGQIEEWMHIRQPSIRLG